MSKILDKLEVLVQSGAQILKKSWKLEVLVQSGAQQRPLIVEAAKATHAHSSTSPQWTFGCKQCTALCTIHNWHAEKHNFQRKVYHIPRTYCTEKLPLTNRDGTLMICFSDPLRIVSLGYSTVALQVTRTWKFKESLAQLPPVTRCTVSVGGHCSPFTLYPHWSLILLATESQNAWERCSRVLRSMGRSYVELYIGQHLVGLGDKHS